MEQTKGLHIDLKVKLMVLLAVAIIYGWIAPKWFAPHRHDPSSFPMFIGLHLITLAGAIIFALGRKPKRPEFVALVVVIVAWIYLFFFVMLNSFGS